MSKGNIFVLMKTSSEDEDERRLQDVFIKTNVCWVVKLVETQIWSYFPSKLKKLSPSNNSGSLLKLVFFRIAFFFIFRTLHSKDFPLSRILK